MKETLQQALIRIDRLQHQVDSLKGLGNHKIELLQSQLDQSNNTVSNLGTLSTAWGTMYAIVGIILGLITVALAIVTWLIPKKLNQKANKAIRKNEEKLDTKLIEIQNQTNLAIENNTLKLNDQMSTLSKNILEETNILRDVFANNLQTLDEKYKLLVAQAEANIFAISADMNAESKNFFTATEFSISATMINLKYNFETTLANLSFTAFCIKNLNEDELSNIIKSSFNFRGESFYDLLQKNKDIREFRDVIIEIENLLNFDK